MRAAAFDALNTNVRIAHVKGQAWSGYDPNDIQLEVVSPFSNVERNFSLLFNHYRCNSRLLACQTLRNYRFSLGRTPSCFPKSNYKRADDDE